MPFRTEQAGPARVLTLRRAVVTAGFVLSILGGSLAGVLLAYENDLPQVSSLEDFEPNIITQVFAADGSVLGEFAIEKRVVVRFADIPPVLRNAVVAVEDADFWKHLGVNPWRIPGAALANLRSGRREQGSSTLTMQLSRLLFLTPEKTYERKIKEVILAFQIEKNFTKEEIFSLYCNQVYFGHGQYGVEAASRFFFGKPARELTLPEAALLAGLPQNPSRLSPIDHPDRARERRGHVLRRMVEEKYVSAPEADAAAETPLGLHVKKDPPTIAPHFLEEVRKYLEREYGSQRIYQGGLKVYTTLDPALQRIANQSLRQGLRVLDRRSRGFVPTDVSILVDGAFPDPVWLDEWDWPMAEGDVVHGVVLASERAVAVVQIGDYRARLTPREMEWTRRASAAEALPRGAIAPFRVVSLAPEKKEAKVLLEQEPKVEGALVAVDVHSGSIRAMVGGYDFERSKFNRATQARRQVGSAFKPFIYSAAIETLGWTASTLIVDAPISFPNPWNKTVWTPHNYDFAFLGPIPVRRALPESRNIPAVKTLQAVGVEKGIDYAHKMGLAGEFQPFLPIALGAGEATPLEMAAAFAAFPNEGLRMKPYMVTRITDRDGNIIEEGRPEAVDAIRADTAYLMTSLLRGVVQRGTAVRARALKRPVAGKTGTTNDFTDAWFVGFEPSMAAAVWVGYDDKRLSLGKREEGGRAALPIWMDFWAQAMKDKPVEEYKVPGNIVFVPVDGMGRPGKPGVPGVQMEAYIAGTEPHLLSAGPSGPALSAPGGLAP
ncbi:MAG TPA: PBP1A family penicillin-binding protein [Vicinamibacteria bacterium]|nr:PBP1A family penicillin-binding protein [Vicinamibacteria bacterium]